MPSAAGLRPEHLLTLHHIALVVMPKYEKHAGTGCSISAQASCSAESPNTSGAMSGSLCKTLVALCVSAPLVASLSPKRGIARANLREHQLHALKYGVSWGYNWELDPHFYWGSAGMDFSPMVHNAGFNRGAGGQQFRALLGFNEPDIHSQAHMNPWHAAAIWPEVEQVARNYGVQTLVSPAMCGDIGKGTSWMQQFLDACKGCRIDAIAIHSYWCSLDGVRNLVQQYKRFGKKIWLTEFACAAPGVDVSMQGQIKFMKDVVPYLEQEDMVEKYAWFSYFTNEWSHGITNPNPDAGLVDWNGALSELGRVYVSLGHRRLEGNATIQDIQPNVTQPIFP